MGRDASAPRILIVDDDPDWRAALHDSLKTLGFESDAVSSGEEALARIAREPYRVVLLDLYMPGLGGEEVARRIPAGGPQVVFVTSAGAQEAGPALAGGPHYYLPKGAGRDALELLLQSLGV